MGEGEGMTLFELIKKSIKIIEIKGDSVTIGTEKGFWSKGLEFGDKKRFKKIGIK